MKVAVVGGGVIGLSVAYELAAAGLKITLCSPQPLDDITSFVAAAFWRPFWIGAYDRDLAVKTLQRLQTLATLNTPGVAPQRFDEWLTADAIDEATRPDSQTHWWRDLPGVDIEYLPQSPPKTFFMDGELIELPMLVRFNTVVARMPDYLKWLQSQVLQTDHVTLQTSWIESIDSLIGSYDYIVNCTGWGAKQLIRDDPETASMPLLAGHVVTVDCPAITHGMLFHGKPFEGRSIYIVPRSGSRSDVLCGGTAIVTEPLPNVRASLTHLQAEHPRKIMERVYAAVPELQSAPVLSQGTGLRPMRSALRLEWDAKHRQLMHCYGHGGSGLTLSWGSAERVATLLKSAN